MSRLHNETSTEGHLVTGRSDLSKNLQTAVFASGLFALCFVIANLLSPDLVTTYWAAPRRSFDLDFYLSIAERGYMEPSWPAFYPLWPLILNWYAKLLHLPSFLPMAHGLSILFFFTATISLWSLIKRLSNAETATWLTLLVSLNPNAIFHALAYPESFFCLLAVLLLTQLHSFLISHQTRHLMGIAVLTSLITVTRPVLPQLLASCMAIVIFFNLKKQTTNRATKINWIKICVVMLLAGSASYIPFGLICWKRFGDFFQPFLAQSLWNRKLGFYWDLIFNPKTVGGSDNVLAWELLAFYGPAMALIYYMTRSQPNHERKSNMTAPSQEIIIFCLMVCAAHAAIAFLTYPIFMSLGRHVLSTPFFFVGATGLVTTALKKPVGSKFLLFLTIISAAYLVNFWTRFARLAWIG